MANIVWQWTAVPRALRLVTYGAAGGICGLAVLASILTNATSYLGDDPKACINCHVMIPQFVSWERSSHREVAHCSDCHIPHDTFLNKWAYKFKSGAVDTDVYITHGEPKVITLKESSVETVKNNCIRCHAEQTMALRIHNETDRKCWDCHREMIHGRPYGLTSTPYARYPRMKPKSSE